MSLQTTITRFVKYCHENNMHLLRDDIAYLKKILAKCDLSEIRPVLHDYSKKWYEGIAECTNVQNKQNFARKRANIWIREYMNHERNKKK